MGIMSEYYGDRLKDGHAQSYMPIIGACSVKSGPPIKSFWYKDAYSLIGPSTTRRGMEHWIRDRSLILH